MCDTCHQLVLNIVLTSTLQHYLVLIITLILSSDIYVTSSYTSVYLQMVKISMVYYSLLLWIPKLWNIQNGKEFSCPSAMLKVSDKPHSLISYWWLHTSRCIFDATTVSKNTTTPNIMIKLVHSTCIHFLYLFIVLLSDVLFSLTGGKWEESVVSNSTQVNSLTIFLKPRISKNVLKE